MATSGNNANFNVTIGANMDPSGVLNAIKTIQSGFNNLKIDPKIMSGLTKEFSELQTLVKDYQKIMGKENISKADIKNLQKLEGSINSSFSRIIELQNQINGKNIVLKVDATQLDELHKKTEAARKALSDAFGKVNIGNNTGGLTQIESALEKAVSRSKTLKTSFTEAFESLNKGEISQFSNKLDNIFNNLTSKVKAGKLIPTVDSLLSSFKQLGLIDINVNTNSAAEKLLALKDGIQALKNGIATGLNGDELKGLVKNLEDAAKAEKDFESAAIERGQDKLSARVGETERLAAATRDAAKAQTEFQQATLSAQDQVKQLQQSTQYFFSLRNMINLLKRGMREAVDVVKELDAAMTETAVVTNFSVGDMWDKLPEYTANANALGASVVDMYKATTLYYQQGLNTEQAMGIATETMKMARIGGLEAADATDKMTAALRGFNMELSETSAQRVNDVYSNLAAKTASDTKELGTAMQRTASIAASAGMSFEGTAAFLAQAIETTREPAENLGTAMKTIVARFTELKKNPLEIADVDGEEVDYNKVDTALKSIGVALKDTNGQFRNLDQVFLDISERWDSLTQTQQRYIATTAAGSRQQSRFIAMMSNYERTVQLMDYANNSAGASNEQFGKTMESLEAKLNKLKNAWNEFLMNIMNDSWTKGIVNAGTKVLNTVNKIIEVLSFGGKAKGIKSILSIFTAFTALKGVGRLANAAIGGLGGLLDPKSSFGTGFKGAFNQGAVSGAIAGKITTPIISKLDQLIAAVKGAKTQAQKNKVSTVEDYNKAAGAFQQVGIDKSLTMGQTGDLFKDLSSAHATAAFNSGAGTVSAMKRTSTSWLSSIAGQIGMDAHSQKIGQQLMNGIYRGMKKGQISPSEGIKLLGKPEEWGKAFGTPVAQQFSEAFSKQFKAYRKQQFNDLFNSREVRNATLKALGKSPIMADSNLNNLRQTNPEFDRQFKREQRRQYVRMRNQMMQDGTYLQGLDNQAVESQTTMERLGTSISQIGQKFTSAGFSIQMFGQQLSMLSPALSGVGNAIAMLGTAVTTLGMGMNTVGTIGANIGGIVSALGGLSVAIPVVLGLGAAIGALAYDIKKTRDIKAAAEEVVKGFEDIKTETTKNIDSLEQMKGEFEQLSSGVDQFGNNINLDNSEYERYREIVGQIAEINPSIVEGYNSQGDAIINNNNALRETLDLQKQIKAEATAEYLSTSSLRKLIEARDKNADYTGRQKGPYTTGDPRVYEASKYVEQLIKAGVSDEVFTRFGLDADKLANKDTAELLRLTENIDRLSNHIDTLNFSDSVTAKLEDAAISLHDASTAFNDAVQPVYENLSAYATENRLNTDFTGPLAEAYQNGLRKIAASPMTAGEMQKAARKLSTKLFAYIGKDSKFNQALDKIKEAKEIYAKNLNEQAYLAKINSVEIAGSLNSIVGQYKDSADETERIVAEMAANTLAEAKNLDNLGLVNLSDAFDTVAKHMDAVISAANEFKEAVEGLDPARGTNALKSIYDTIYGEDSIHALAEGDGVYWKGVKSFVSDELYRSGDKDTIDAIMKTVAPALAEGAEGVIAANKFLVDRISESDFAYKDYFTIDDKGQLGIKGTIDEETFQKIAESADGFNMNVDAFGAIMGRLSQFGLDFSNYDKIRESYASDERVYKGGEDTKVGSQNGLLVSYDQALNDALSNNKSPKEFADEIIPALKEQNVDILPALEKNGENNAEIGRILDKYSIDSSNYIEALSDMLVPKEDIQTIGEEILGADTSNFEEQYAELIAGKDDPIGQITNDKLESINGYVQSIAQSVDKNPITKGEAKESDFVNDKFKDYIFDPEGEIRRFAMGQDRYGQSFTTKQDVEDAKSHITSGVLEQLMTYKNQLQTGMNNTKDVEEYDLYADKIKDIDALVDYITNMVNRGESEFETERIGGEDKRPSGPDKYLSSLLSESQEFGNQFGEDFKAILSQLNPEEIAASTDLTSSLASLYNDIISGSLPKLEDLQNLGIADMYQQFGGKVQEDASEIADTTSFLSIKLSDLFSSSADLDLGAEANVDGFLASVGEFLKTTYDTISETDNTAAAYNIAGNDVITKAITGIGERLKNWWDKIHGVEGDVGGETNTPSPSAPSAPEGSSQSSEYTIETSNAEAKILVVQTKLKELNDLVSQGGTYNLTVTGVKDIKSAASAAKTLTKNSGTKTIGVKTGKADTSSVDKAKVDIGNTQAKIQVGANVDSAIAAARRAQRTIEGMSAKIDVEAHVKKTGINSISIAGKTYTVNTNASGQHNHGYVASPTFGSAAKGYGQVGPKGKGGLTLTGELGYEIAWLPDENRSMILGANGPQMIDLPSNAVVWTHEQSKKILKQKAIPAGSHATVSGQVDLSSLRSYTGGKGSTSKTVTQAANKITHSATSAAAAVGKVSVWWENIARKTETTQRKADTAYSDFQRFVKNMQATLKLTGTKGQGDKYITNMIKVLGYQKSQYNKADRELKRLNTSKATTKIKYGKNKKKDIALGNYIKYDKESGTYVIDQKKITKVAKNKKRGKAEAEAIKDAAEKKLNDKLSKRNKAEDAIRKTKEALDKFGDELYKTFFAWENELTKIWNITQKITQAESNISRIKAIQETLDKQLATGLVKASNAFKEESLNKFTLEVQESIGKINDYQDLITEQQTAVNRALSLTDEKDTLQNIQKKLAGKDLNKTERAGYEAYAQNLQERINAQAAAHKYLNVTTNADGTLKIDFNTEAFEADKFKGNYTEDAAKAIQDYVKELVDSSEELNKDYTDLNNEVNNMYDSLSSLQDAWAGYADELWDISEAETKKEVDNLKKLSDSISNSLKNLLDEVKNKLDERRKREDNAKTESDIARKQQRLAALRADTSGGHQVEIAQLEKEIADAQQDYQRTLEDQLLDKLQQQADLAEKQRERQIELQEQIASEINNAEQVDKWMAILSNPEATEADKDTAIQEMWEAFKTANDYDKKPLALQESLERQFNAMVGGMMTNQEKQAILTNSIDTLNGTIQAIKQSIEDMQEATSSRSFKQLEGLGLDYSEIRKAGFGLQAFKNNGVTNAKDLRKAGFFASTLFNDGYTLDQLRKAGYSASTLQKIVNKDPNDAARQKGLGGMKAGKVDINGSKKGGIVKDSHLSSGGTRIGANSGSTLYHADWNEEKGKAGTKWTGITVEKLTPKLMKTYPVDAKQALEYAIKHRTPGSKINANMKELIQAAKQAGQTMAGNSYKLSNGYNARLGGDGTIHYSGTKDKKDGVYVWNPSTGKLSFRQYDKKKFTDWAKSPNVGSEYKYVLKKKGVKFATGGLADFTGPAWLDGTPSKPELVLNAKDTQNFIALKDVLANAMSGMGDTSNTYGDVLYEININVDKIEKDYDVDRVVKKVKEEITKGAGYRNVTQVRNFR